MIRSIVTLSLKSGAMGRETSYFDHAMDRETSYFDDGVMVFHSSKMS